VSILPFSHTEKAKKVAVFRIYMDLVKHALYVAHEVLLVPGEIGRVRQSSYCFGQDLEGGVG